MNLGSSEWLDRRDGLASLQTLLRTDARLTSVLLACLHRIQPFRYFESPTQYETPPHPPSPSTHYTLVMHTASACINLL